mmetsp:Transcript_27679/g.40706  ORF Transcript_27679/g.40706 Transcript_27679/m.40706 type:complete len:226 (+) Transcript_27679:30-707(+)|eukprot:CAMPEP_0179422672 /NCGR_PEP_ID=MMETSP0799-20121207/10564_1 /TAXON_ID=46947 /ORGANISM="Geminigera cryophila, Strain CCMP2564" /LENGTH=225 /DNA_ID=CAMNT_0021196841 /DNA_START=36 /DNA_END=713 /DNA_ORIENTATION=+
MPTSVAERLHAVDPRRRVNRSLYPKGADMPEFPGAVLLNHVGLRSAQLGAAAGVVVLSPLLWMRSGFKTPLFLQLMPKIAGRCFVLGYFGGVGGVVAMAVADKQGRTNQPLADSLSLIPSLSFQSDSEDVDDRAFRIVQNPKVQQIADFSSAGMVGAALVCRGGIVGNLAFGSLAGVGAYAFANVAMPKIRKEYWPQYKPQLIAALKSAGVDFDSLTTGGDKKKK